MKNYLFWHVQYCDVTIVKSMLNHYEVNSFIVMFLKIIWFWFIMIKQLQILDIGHFIVV